EDTITRFIDYFRRIVSKVIADAGKKIGEIEIISEEEKREILNDFNDTETDYPSNKTIQQLFAEQVDKAPHLVSLVYMTYRSYMTHMTYGRLDEESDRLAHLLVEKGVASGDIVAIMLERSVEMIVGVLAILKTGGAYLPISPEYPEDRVNYMLADSNARLLLAKELDIFHPDSRTPHPVTRNSQPATSLAYIIYTSGSTGKPKGVMVEHINVVRLVKNTNYVEFREGDRVLQTGALEFDASTFEIWGSLLNGLQLYLVDNAVILSPQRLKEVIGKNLITTMWLTAPLFNQMLLEDVEIFTGLRNLLVGGDVLSPFHINRLRERFPALNIINGYGPTENTTFSTTFLIDKDYDESIPIGGPIANSTAYIVDRFDHLVPVGVVGELLVGGEGVSRGYLNNPELTNKKFLRGPGAVFSKRAPGRRRPIYRTGDLARWFSDGTIDFLGRKDQQVKIRGYRIELEEIENRLLSHEQIREAVVIDREDAQGVKYLVAYIVGAFIETPQLKKYLSQTLPEYMIPSYFVQMEKIPLTANGKVDRRALPEPERAAGTAYAAPRDEIEEKMAGIWAAILSVDKGKIGIDDNFFELGGHSLKGTVMIARVHKVFNVKISLADIFQAPDIRRLSAYIKASVEDEYFSIEPVEKKDYYPLSSAQKRLYVLDQMEYESIAYNIPALFELAEAPDPERLEAAFKQLIKRHESFRTCFIMVNDEPVQRVMDEVDFSLSLTSGFIHPFILSRAPLLRAALIEAAEGRALLFVDMHHIISDGVSMEIFQRELPAAYDFIELPPLKLQYKDFARWQTRGGRKEEIEAQEAYWLKMFAGEIPVLNLPSDYARPVVQSFEGSKVSFELGRGETGVLKQLAREEGATMFMVLAAVFNVLLSKLTGQEDIVVGSPTAGRRHGDLENIIGMFVNTLPLRNQPTGEKCFTDFLQEVKKRTIEVFENQDYQFEELVERLSVARDTGRNPLFDVMYAMQNMEKEAPGESGLKLSGPRYETGISKFDLTLFAEESEEGLYFELEYSSKLFKEETVKRFARYFESIVSQIIAETGKKIGEIEIISREEKREILYDFNDTETNYASCKTIQQLFEQQVECMPDAVAAAVETGGLASMVSVTYKVLNQRAGRLAGRLMKEGIVPGTLTGIMVE
ncbi:MAG: amino acid adenylation domain-containing protein, partial [bacterium]|nr:amino acid adenylation domain-containing protein [bacterium]